MLDLQHCSKEILLGKGNYKSVIILLKEKYYSKHYSVVLGFCTVLDMTKIKVK